MKSLLIDTDNRLVVTREEGGWRKSQIGQSRSIICWWMETRLLVVVYTDFIHLNNVIHLNLIGYY